MKKSYMKPTLRVVEVQKRRLVCGSPGGYNKYPVPLHKVSGGGDTIYDEDIDDII